MSNNTNGTFRLEEVALSNSHFLPDDNQKAIYFVTVMQGGSKKIIFIGFAQNLRKKFATHKRKLEFDFLDRMGYQINISWLLFPDGTHEREEYAVQRCYIRAFEPKLNEDQNSIPMLQAEESKKQQEIREQSQYHHLEKQIENWQKNGDEQNTIIQKIWEVAKESLMLTI
jgi:hypothetical protein